MIIHNESKTLKLNLKYLSLEILNGSAKSLANQIATSPTGKFPTDTRHLYFGTGT